MAKLKIHKTQKGTFRLIGILLGEMDKTLMKNLSAEWYPFGKYEAPVNGYVERKPISLTERNIYQIKRDLPSIHVECIVGMNGSGKSTILELLYRILNNFAYRLLDITPMLIKPDVEYANGVDATLYYEKDGLLYRLECQDDNVGLYKQDAENSMKEVELTDTDSQSVLENLFYTIGFNYSIYAFNEKDYKNEEEPDINGKWLNGMFHKNDGYWVPLTLVPQRDEGMIDINRENDLAQQRIMALSILWKAKGRQFPAGYHPEFIEYKLNRKYKEDKWNKFLKTYTQYDNETLENIRLKFECGWKSYLKENGIITDFRTAENSTALFYLAYKTLKTCLTYNEYFVESDMSILEQIMENKNTDLEIQYRRNLPDLVQSVINSIERHKDDHVTLKIHQCLNYLRDRNRYSNVDEIIVDEFIETYKPQTYSDVATHLLPPFFTTDIKFSKIRRKYTSKSSWSSMQTEFSLSRMSSGEKQMLYAVSYVLYHLNNLQNVKDERYRVPYKYINLVFDEAELYYHPDYQRRFLGMLLESLYWAKINRRKIRGINILIATHSPFVLSDMLLENTLYLKNGERQIVERQTFGGNYYDMLQSSFFFDKNAIGDVAARTYRSLVKDKKKGEELSKESLNVVGDSFVKSYLKMNDNDVQSKD